MLKLNNIQLYFFSLLILPNICFSQDLWYRIDKPHELTIRSLAVQSDGEIFLSPKGSVDIYQFNIVDLQQQINKLPKITYAGKYDPFVSLKEDRLTISCNNNLIIFGLDGMYEFNNSKINKFSTIDSNLSRAIYNASDLRYNEDCIRFYSSGSSIFMMDKSWQYRSSTKIFETAGSIRNFNTFTDSINYALVVNNGITQVYKFNTSNQEKRLLFEVPLEVNKNSLINRNGDFLLAVEQELYYYKNEGKELIVPILDSSISANGYVRGIFSSMDNKSILCYKAPNFYITYDSCKTWTIVSKFGKDLPLGNVKNFYYWDTTHALVYIQNYCKNNLLYKINTENTEWKNVLVDEANHNFYELSSNKKEVIAKNECYYMKSTDEGLNWNFLSSPFDNMFFNKSDFVDFLSLDNVNEVIFTFDFLKDTLYRSYDFGNSWNKIGVFPKIHDIFRINQRELILTTDATKSSIDVPKFNFYYSNDNGDNWSLKIKDFVLGSLRYIKSDNNGDLLLLTTELGKGKLLISKNKGNTWTVDNRFKSFSIYDVFFEKNGKCIINGKDSTGVIGIFITYDFINYNRISEGIDNFSVNGLIHIGENQYACMALGISQKLRGLFYTNDDGRNWTNISYNLPDFNSAEIVQWVNEFKLDDQGFLNITLPFQGLWRLNKKLIASRDITMNSGAVVFPNPVSDHLVIQLKEDLYSENSFIEINNIYGSSILRENINLNKIVNVSNLNQGTYILKIYSDGKLINSQKIIKY